MKTYDEKCFDLAVLFLSDEPALDTPKNRDELAGDIQALIEDFIFVKRREKEAGAQ
jgi:hypothetical protein